MNRSIAKYWGMPALAVLILVATGFGFHLWGRASLRHEAENDLLTVAHFKAQQIAEWHQERISEAAVLSAAMTRSPGVVELLTAPPSPSRFVPDLPLGPLGDVRSFFRDMVQAHQYQEILLVDASGRILLSTKPGGDQLEEHARSTLASALREGALKTDDLHVCLPDSSPHFSIIAPFYQGEGVKRRPLGAVVFVTEARTYLYPLIQIWPRASRTAELILVRQEGDSVVILNDLRHRPRAALSVRYPLTLTTLPAVMAVAGKEGVSTGVDYRGVDVLSAYAPVPGTPWFIVAKEDAAEALSEVKRTTGMFLILVAFTILLVGAVAMIRRQREKRTHFQALYRAESDMRRAAGRHQVVLQSIGDAVIATDAQGRVDLMNAEAERQTGWTIAEARGRPLEEVFTIVNEETRERVESPVVRVLREQAVVGLANHTVLLPRNGPEHPIADSGAPVLEEDGTLSGVVLVFRDQSEERAAQQALRESESRFRATFEHAAVGVTHVAPDGRLLLVNQRLCEILGYPREELEQMTFQQVTPPDDVVLDLENVHRQLAGEFSVYSTEKRYIRRDGSHVWVELTSSLVRDDSNAPLYFITVVQDITRRKQDEAERNRLMSAIEQSAEAVVITDANAEILYVNPAFERITGYSMSEVVGQNPRFLKSGRHDEAFYKAMWGTLLAGEVFEGRISNRRKDGNLFIEQMTISPVRDHGGAVVSYVAVNRDVTEETRLEDQLRQAQKMEAVGRLAGGVAHDFNNILQALLGYGAMLQELAEPGSEIAEYAGEIVRGGERAAALTRQLLAFSRKQTIAPKILDLNDVVVGMLKLLGRLIGENVDLHWKPSFNLGPVRMDPEQINQILANLVVNARDAISDTGSITIETNPAEFDADYCAHHEGSLPGRYAMLAISDTGCGMDEETRAKIFEPFFTTKELGKGTGLGLSTVYGIVKQNAGFISVYSEPGTGTNFRIYLPVVEDGVEVESAGTVPAVIHTGTEVILLVEDERPLLRFAERLLRSLGYTVLAADSPVKALDLARNFTGHIHLLLTDVIMPGMSGRDLYQTLAALLPHLRCLYISGYSSDVIAHQGILDEGVHFLAKPFTRGELAAKLRMVLDS